MRVLIRVAAGPRLGFGHLLRARALARALDGDVRVSVRGRDGHTRARRLGLVPAPGGPGRALRAVRPLVLVIDDPSAGAARPWLRAARRANLPVASIHDLGLAPIPSDLRIDGSALHDSRRTPGRLAGPRFAVLDPALGRSGRAPGARAPRVLIALGGGPRAVVACRLASLVAARCPRAEVRVAGGFVSGPPPVLPDRTRWIRPASGLERELRRCTVAVLAGGVTAYEACALGVPAVALSVVRAQRPAIRALAERGGLVDAGRCGDRAAEIRAAEAVRRLLDDPAARRRAARRGRALVDGRGALRVAHAIRALAGELR